MKCKSPGEAESFARLVRGGSVRWIGPMPEQSCDHASVLQTLLRGAWLRETLSVPIYSSLAGQSPFQSEPSTSRRRAMHGKVTVLGRGGELVPIDEAGVVQRSHCATNVMTDKTIVPRLAIVD